MKDGQPNKELYEMCLAHFNEPMISHGVLARCIGYGETAVDCYIIVMRKGGQVIWNTCVGGYIWLDRLKGQGYVKATNGEDWDDLTRLDGDLRRWDAPKQDQFRLELNHHDWEGIIPPVKKTEQFIAHMDEMSPAVMMEIRKVITDYLTERDKENEGKTNWANEEGAE